MNSEKDYATDVIETFPMHPMSDRVCRAAVQNQPGCMTSRLRYLSFFVVLTFTLCIINEFTFIFIYSTTESLKKYLILRRKQDDDWNRVTDSIYIYSAYFDTRFHNETFVRIIGGAAFPENNLNLTKCLLKINYSTVVEIPTKYEILSEHHNEPCKAIYIKCTLPRNQFPSFAAVVPVEWKSSKSITPNWVAVKNLGNAMSSGTFAVCVRPIFNFTDAFRISEFIAYYEALGVSHFTFYDYDISVDIIKYLGELRKENYSIDVLPWSLPSTLSRMWAVGQIASINGCIYRNMKTNMYIAIVDLDEFIIPRLVTTLQGLLQLQDVPHKRAASFVFRSCIFCAEFKRDILPSVILPFETQSNIRRENYIYPYLIRSKYIVKPYLIEVAGVHHVWNTLPGWEEKFIPASQALVHHYRKNL